MFFEMLAVRAAGARSVSGAGVGVVRTIKTGCPVNNVDVLPDDPFHRLAAVRTRSQRLVLHGLLNGKNAARGATIAVFHHYTFSPQ